jgi:two-component system, cell cycle sensor histidine kinase and response regulator CckA
MTITDRHARREREDAVDGLQREVEDDYRTLVETCPDGIVAIDMNGGFVLANRAAAQMRGYASVEEFLASGENAITNIIEEQRPRAAQNMELALRTGRVERLEYDTHRRDGSNLPIELTASVLRTADGTPRGFVGVVRDITERRAAEAERARIADQMRHAQRLESLGLLAGGIAHDFNNLLVGILGNASLALGEVPVDSHVHQCLEQIHRAASSAADLTAQMLAYAGEAPAVNTRVDMASVICESVTLVRSASPKNVVLCPHIAADVPLVLGNPVQLKQVVMNLITNAYEAMPVDGGIVEIDLAAMTSPGTPPPGVVVGVLAPDTAHVCLVVRDTGRGFDSAVRERMCDPFFTTKQAGRGLGMAIVLGVVRSHSGLLAIDSAPGRGTTVTVCLPAHHDRPALT